MSQNKVTYGLQNVHVAFFDESNPSQPAWETPIAIPGAVRWTPTTQGEPMSFYADNHKYYAYDSNNGYTAELEMALVPDAILARMLGWEIDNNGMIVEGDGAPTKFALLGQVQGDKRNRRFVYYDVQANRPNKERTTKGETLEVASDVLPVSVSPIQIGGGDKMAVKGEMELSDTNAAAYNSFFSAVTVPSTGAVNKADLAAAIDLAESFDDEIYTVESWGAVSDALVTANAVNADVNAPQNTVDAARNTLQHAILRLVTI